MLFRTNHSFTVSKLISFHLFFVCSFIGYSQSFDLEQIEQIWRPRLKLESKYLGPSSFSDTTGNYKFADFNAGLTFPIKSKLGADLKLDLSSLKLKDILKNSVKLRAYQVLGNVKFGMRQANLGFDSISQRNLMFAQGGVLGLWLTNKYRIGFYSVNIFITEDKNTLNKTVPRVSGMIGQYHLQGLRKNFYYGLYASYSDGLIIPVPFFGGKFPMGEKVSFNYLIPAQIYVQYSPASNTTFCGGVTLDGYRSAVELYTKRLNMNYGSVNAYINYKQKLNKLFSLRIEGGYCIKQYIKINDAGNYRSNYPINQGFYGQITITTLFGKSFFEKITEGIKDKIF